MKYKIGDKVRIKSFDWYNENKDDNGNVHCGDKVFDNYMSVFCGSVVTIGRVYPYTAYNIREDMHCRAWTDEMIEGIVEEPLVFTGKEFLLKVANIELPSGTTKIWECPKGYQFVDENGNVINATKIVLEKKKNEYPKTYEECCVLLGAVKDRHYFFTKKDKNDYPNEVRILNILDDLRRLLICRDAYWKIAGEEMGLGKPWEPDYTEKTVKYCLRTNYCRIVQTRTSHDNHPFSFPTEEMRDAFYENFKELIESCKELL